ncbi:uncharacterized protein LOC135383974 [Ornithodoros turicata]|uniref:uncharacterized protein LOC135383974 n=1 Tax=Ornithodoros turicata TaxID=34597 RepID=UPI00313A250D
MSKGAGKELSGFSAELKRELKNGFKEIQDTLERNYPQEMREMKASMEHMSYSFDEMTRKFNDLINEQKQLVSENAELRKENERVKNELSIIKTRLTECEQYSRNRNVEIKGIPEDTMHDISSVLSKIGEALGEPISSGDIDVCHSVPVPNSAAKNIIVQFRHRSKRDAVIGKARDKRINTSDVDLAPRALIFVNEQLCSTLKKVLGLATAKKKESKLAYVWVRNGKVFIRKSEGSPVIAVYNADDVI